MSTWSRTTFVTSSAPRLQKHVYSTRSRPEPSHMQSNTALIRSSNSNGFRRLNDFSPCIPRTQSKEIQSEKKLKLSTATSETAFKSIVAEASVSCDYADVWDHIRRSISSSPCLKDFVAQKAEAKTQHIQVTGGILPTSSLKENTGLQGNTELLQTQQIESTEDPMTTSDCSVWSLSSPDSFAPIPSYPVSSVSTSNQGSKENKRSKRRFSRLSRSQRFGLADPKLEQKRKESRKQQQGQLLNQMTCIDERLKSLHDLQGNMAKDLCGIHKEMKNVGQVLGNVAINPGTSEGVTFTSDSCTTAHQGKMFLGALPSSTVVYTVPNSGITQQGLERSLLFSQLLPLGQNAQGGIVTDGSLQSMAATLVNSVQQNFTLASPSLISGTGNLSSVSEGQCMTLNQSLSVPVTSAPTVISISNANYEALKNSTFITGQDVLSVSSTQPALVEIAETGDNTSGPPEESHRDIIQQHMFVLHTSANGKEGLLPVIQSKSTNGDIVMQDTKSNYVLGSMMNTVCGELETDKKELAKLQNVDMDEDMQDI